MSVHRRYAVAGVAAFAFAVIAPLAAVGIVRAASSVERPLLTLLELVAFAGWVTPGVVAALVGTRFRAHLAALPAGLVGLELVVTQVVVGPAIGEPYVDGLIAVFPWLMGAFYLAVYGTSTVLGRTWSRHRTHAPTA